MNEEEEEEEEKKFVVKVAEQHSNFNYCYNNIFWLSNNTFSFRYFFATLLLVYIRWLTYNMTVVILSSGLYFYICIHKPYNL